MMRKGRWFILGGAVVLAGFLVFLGLGRNSPAQNFTAKVERGAIHDVVEATGTINAVTTVQVGSQVSGSIAKLNADFNSRVRKGDVIALIDPALFEGAVQQAKADLDNARANLVAARANVDKERAVAVQTRADFERSVDLNRSNLLSQQLLDQARASADSAAAAVGAAVAAVTQAEAQVSQKEATLRIAQTNLDYTVIRSPIDGTVVARNVELGQTVAASLQAPTLFTIAQDLTKMLVYTKTDESDVGNIHPGRAVTFKVDAFPKDVFHGVVKQVRMNPTMVQSVVTYDSIIEFENTDRKLFPGMTAYVTIPVDSIENALKLPNTALRYKPPMSIEELRAEYARHGIDPDAPARNAGAAGTGGSSAPTKKPARETAVVWKLRSSDNTMEPVQVSLGLTDHTYTEVAGVLKGSLKEGDELVIRSILAKSQGPSGIRR
ncbi:MAG TPA: efflux RND transporter periplasmic adaptor subunit [Thermoanaerobaculia bacterium]|nr:efflux RND transporter periplasmic adaptor subunit [Thermoanaerobaculia bacterium]